MGQVDLYLWDYATEEWVPAPAAVVTKRMTGVGLAVGGVHKLYWVACSPSAPAAEWQLTDTLAGGVNIVYDHFDTDKDSEHIHISPPMQFTTGIYVQKFDKMTSLVFGYI